MKQIKIFRSYIFFQIYKFISKIFCSEKVKEKYNHYKRKYTILSTKTVSYKEFLKYIKQREKLPLDNIENISAFLPFYVQSNELWAWNDFYGAGEIYKKYAGYPSDYKLKFVIDHTIQFRENYCTEEEYTVNLPAHIVTSDFAKVQCQKYTNSELFPVSLLINYADDYYTEEKFQQEKQKLGKNLLVFPSHSSDVVVAEFNPQNLIDEILKIKKQYNFDSVSICFYYADIQRKFHKKFEGYGFNFVTAGHILDPMFISRLKTIIKLSDVTMSNAIGSHTFYSIGLNKPHYSIYEKNYQYKNIADEKQGNTQQKYEDVLVNSSSVEYYTQLFNKYSETLTSQQLKERDKICCLTRKRTQKEMKEFFERTENLYQNGDYIKENKKYTHIFTLQIHVENENG